MGADWAGRGTGVDDAGLARKIAVIDEALGFHAPALVVIPATSALRSMPGADFFKIRHAAEN